MRTRSRRALSVAAGAVPFGFALIRAIQTDARDLRYFLVALAALGGAVAFISLAAPTAPAVLAAGVFLIAMTAAIAAASALGTVFGPGILVVAAGFAFWYAVAALLEPRGRVDPR